MQLSFSESKPDIILEKIQETLGNRPLAKIMSFEMDLAANEFLVKFSKMGTTTLKFDAQIQDSGIQLSLAKEKIALAHKPFYGEVKNKMIKVLGRAGATVS